MVLFYVITIIDRNKSVTMIELYRECQSTLVFSHLASGTATSAILSENGIAAQEKAVISAVAGSESLKQLVHQAKKKMCLDIPGSGIMMAVPIKSVGGKNNMASITEKTMLGSSIPEMRFDHELIIVILNEGHSDEVMDAARSAGATGGTVLHAKGTGAIGAKAFFGLSLAVEKDVIYIAARAADKAAIMHAITRLTGKDTPAGAICFSLPISSIVGIRAPENDD